MSVNYNLNVVSAGAVNNVVNSPSGSKQSAVNLNNAHDSRMSWAEQTPTQTLSPSNRLSSAGNSPAHMNPQQQQAHAKHGRISFMPVDEGAPTNSSNHAHSKTNNLSVMPATYADFRKSYGSMGRVSVGEGSSADSDVNTNNTKVATA